MASDAYLQSDSERKEQTTIKLQIHANDCSGVYQTLVATFKQTFKCSKYRIATLIGLNSCSKMFRCIIGNKKTHRQLWHDSSFKPSKARPVRNLKKKQQQQTNRNQ